jgi:phosphotransferase system  glucose/maltose/N-acetylglucosamine-specific IIC component
MITQTSQGNSEIAAYNASRSRKSRRTIKLLVQLSIGIIGLIGVMLAQIADSKKLRSSESEQLSQPHAITSLSHGISDKVESLSQVTPVVSQVTLANILF